MNLATYKLSLQKPLRPRTVSFMVKEGKVLLGYKKSGFGKGNLLGIGGKVEQGETLEKSASRELQEEIKVMVNKFVPMGYLHFYFPHIEDESWNQKVHIFIVHDWINDPQETDEIRPEWYDMDNLPFEQMWDDAQYWLPDILRGKEIQCEFLFDSYLKVVEQRDI